MEYYVFIEAFIGIIAGILLAAFTKKTESVTYGKLDKAGIVTNILLIPTYLVMSPAYLFLGILAYPEYDGFLGFIGWIVAIICASVALCCGLGLGASVALRRKGKSKISFVVQFAGVAAFALMFVLFLIFYGNLLETLN